MSSSSAHETASFKPAKWPRELRSAAWFKGNKKHNIFNRAWLRDQPVDVFDGRPVIGICNTWSELTGCNGHLRELADRVKCGVLDAGGVPLEFPVLSTSEHAMRPTAMLYRNLAAMDVEEMLRSCPLDGVVLLAGCDKTTPALLMGAASANMPAILVSGGPMLNGKFEGENIGSGTDLRRMAASVAAGSMSASRFAEAGRSMTRSEGTCNTMGTASTMASMAEAMGMALSGNAAIPAVDSRRREMARMSGRRIVQMVKDDLKPSDLMVRQAFKNAIVVNAAIGGSTNAVIHLLAIAGRIGVRQTLEDWDRYSRMSPAIVDVMPTGKHLMEEFYYAGGLPVVMRQLIEAGRVDGGVLTASGKSLWSEVRNAANHDSNVIRRLERPVRAESGIAVLRGNLTPTKGAVIKLSAASSRLLKHTGRAVVFDGIDDYRMRVDDPLLDIDETSVMVLRGCGPKGYPGMAEVGDMQIPAKLLRRGVTDIVRISDARMSGTAFGTVILHVCPEGVDRGPLAVVRTGDMIKLDVSRRRLHVDISSREMQQRLKAWKPAHAPPLSGYARLHHQEVEDAAKGCDLRILVGCRGCDVPKDSH